MMRLKNKIFLNFLLCLCFLGNRAFATVIIFNSNGSVTIEEGIDYLSSHERKSKFSNKITISHSSKYQNIILEAGNKYGVDHKLIASVINVESAFQADAVSPKGAEGLMQLMPETAKRFNVKDSFDPEQNIHGGTQYLRFLLKRYDGDINYAVAAYNAGEGAVDKYRGIPPYQETKQYVSKIHQSLNHLE